VTERARRQAFALAVLVVGTAAVLATWMQPRPHRSAASARPASATHATTAAQRRATIQDPAAFEREPASEREPGRTERDTGGAEAAWAAHHAVARRHAAAFMRALFRYEVGDTSPGVRAAIKALADVRLARVLLSAPPRPPRSGSFPPLARLVRFEGEREAPDGAVDVTAQIVRGGERSRITVRVEQAEGRWLATAVG
jgi:hypothetical protein